MNYLTIIGHQWAACKSPPCMLVAEPPHPACPHIHLFVFMQHLLSFITFLLHYILFVFTPIHSSPLPFPPISISSSVSF